MNQKQVDIIDQRYYGNNSKQNDYQSRVKQILLALNFLIFHYRTTTFFILFVALFVDFSCFWLVVVNSVECHLDNAMRNSL